MFYSVNSYSSAATRKGVGGLVSGMDTDELVKNLTAGTRSKITTKLQNKQKALWKQEAYREVSSKISSFKDKYLSYGAGDNNILSPKFFESSSITNTSPYVKVSGDTTAAKNIVIDDIVQLAQTESATSSKTFSSQQISSGEITSTWDESLVNGSSIMVKYGDRTYNLAISSDFAFKNTDNTPELKLNAIVTELNKSITANTDISGKISITNDAGVIKIANTSGDGTNLELMGGETELMAGLGLKTALPAGSTITGESTDVTKLYSAKILKDTLAGSSLTISLNGIEKIINFRELEKDSYQDAASVKTYLQNEIDKAYGSGRVAIAESGGKLTFNTGVAGNTNILTIKSSDKSGVLGTNGALHMTSGLSTRASWSTSLKDMVAQGQLNTSLTPVDGKYKIKINDVDLEFSEKETMSDVVSKINNSNAGVRVTYSTTSDTFTIKAKDSGLNGSVNVQSSADTNDLAFSMFGDEATRTKVAGADAQLNVSFDGGKTKSLVTRSTNNFSLDGLNIELLGKSANDGVPENISFTVEGNTDALVKKLQNFFTDYNEIVKLSNDKITEKHDKNYKPLTDEQKKELSDDEVKNWEKKSKEGLLALDPHLNKLLISMRQVMTGPVEGTDTALSKMGISSAVMKWEENGQLHVDEKKLRTALANDPESITKLFTSVTNPVIKDGATKEEIAIAQRDAISKSGLATRLNDLLNYTAGTFGGDGILIKEAGKTGDSSIGQDKISLQVKSLDRDLKALKDKMVKEEDKYYRQFAKMEQYLSKMNSQSSWLTQQS